MQYLFGDYALDPDRRELSRQAEAVAIGPKVFDLLLYLIQNREHVVSKDDLLEAVWSGRIVSESTLTSHINAVRRRSETTVKSSVWSGRSPARGFVSSAMSEKRPMIAPLRTSASRNWKKRLRLH